MNQALCVKEPENNFTNTIKTSLILHFLFISFGGYNAVPLYID